MHKQSTPTATLPQLPARMIALDRTVIEQLAQAKLDEAHALLALLDRFDGDPDREDDDPAGQCDEDGMNTASGSFLWGNHGGPGCPISDPGERDEGVYQHGA